jgi:hypothetical protein
MSPDRVLPHSKLQISPVVRAVVVKAQNLIRSFVRLTEKPKRLTTVSETAREYVDTWGMFWLASVAIYAQIFAGSHHEDPDC